MELGFLFFFLNLVDNSVCAVIGVMADAHCEVILVECR